MEGAADLETQGKEDTLARTNYQWEKRQRDLAKRKKKEEKLRKKQALKQTKEEDSADGSTAGEGEEE